MKHLARLLFFMLLAFVSTHALAQEAYTISGMVIDPKHEPIRGATVFISGSQQITATDTAGRFIFRGMAAGNYLVSAKMLGHATSSQDIAVHDKSINITFTLETKAILLKEVKISVDKDWAEHYAIFKDQFLGTSGNAKNCVILNAEIIHFNSQKIADDDILLKADADDFLIIENKYLGYKIKYLLKLFEYNSVKHLTFYDGDNNFEELDGTAEQKKVWEQNRLLAYKGSLMHFLRSVYANTVFNEGFITNQIFKSSNVFDFNNYINPNLVKFNTLVTRTDSSSISFKFTALNIVYDPKKADRLQKNAIKEQEKTSNTLIGKSNKQDNPPLPVSESGKNSQLLLHLKEAIIDARGSVLTGYGTFLIRGKWSFKRIGDQLPFEYQPPKIAN